MNWTPGKQGTLLLRSSKESQWDEGFVGLSMALAVTHHSDLESSTGDQCAAVIPLGYGRMRKLDLHKHDKFHLEPSKTDHRSHSASRKTTHPTVSPQTPSSPYLHPLSPFSIPVHYLSRRQRNIPGLIRIKRDSGSQVNFAAYSQSFRHSTPNVTHRGKDTTLSPRPPAKPVTLLTPMRKSMETCNSKVNPTDIKAYDGEYNQGLRHGYGTAEYWSGERYTGNWTEGMREGQGTLWDKAGGNKYTGGWKKDLKHGNGVLTFANNDTLEATWCEGVMTSDPVTLTTPTLTYKGTYKNWQPCGQGVMQYFSDKVEYEGSWNQGNRHGYGVVTFKDGSLFEGYFESDYTAGPGLLVLRKVLTSKPDISSLSLSRLSKFPSSSLHLPDKSSSFLDTSAHPYFSRECLFYSHDLVYKSLSSVQLAASGYAFAVCSGVFAAGKLNGAGVAVYGKYGVYHGGFKDGARSGFGCMIYTNIGYLCSGMDECEGKYTGEWKLDKRHGKGKMEWEDGTVYEGQFREGKRHLVTGKMVFRNGDVYEGAWARNLMHGHGTYTTPTNYQYRGLFTHGHISTEGHLLYPNGNRYEGEIRDLKPNGCGRLHYINGNLYEGELTRGVRMGSGKMTYANKDWYAGEWSEDYRHGTGTMYYHDTKEKYEGNWSRNKRNGQGTLFNSKKEVVYEGNWRDDVMEGKGILVSHDA